MAAGSTIGTIFKVTTWGESHGKAIGVVVDGCPAGLPLDESDIQKLLDRRKPGQSRFTTQRKEGDEVEILSGVFDGKTTGTPISMIVRNTDQRSKDYSNIASCFRPGHADYTFEEKYGFRDYRGGGRSSARETIGRVAAGAIAEKFLKKLNISVTAYAKSIGPVEVSPERMDLSEIRNNRFCLPDSEAAKAAEIYLDQKIAECDSVGGVVECVISGLPVGLGEPVFEKLDANLAKAILSSELSKALRSGTVLLPQRPADPTTTTSSAWTETRSSRRRTMQAVFSAESATEVMWYSGLPSNRPRLSQSPRRPSQRTARISIS